MLNEKWQWRKWSGPKQLEDKKTKTLMMLPYVYSFVQTEEYLTSPHRTDYALMTDKAFGKYVKAYAADENLFFKEYV